MPPVFQPISFIEKSEVSKNFEIPWFFQETVLKNILWKGKTQAVDCRPVAWNISDPCACALQCTIRPATPHRERLRSLGCGSSVGQTLPVNQFFFMSSRDAEKTLSLYFFGFGKKNMLETFFWNPRTLTASRVFLLSAKPYVFSACTRANARLSLFPLNHCSCTSGSQFNLPPDFFSHKRRSRIIRACWDSSSAPPQWKNLCKEELNFKSYIFRFFWTLKKAYNQSTPDKFLALTCQLHWPNLVHWHSQLAHLRHLQALPIQQPLLRPGYARKHKGPVKINTLIWGSRCQNLKSAVQDSGATTSSPGDIAAAWALSKPKIETMPIYETNPVASTEIDWNIAKNQVRVSVGGGASVDEMLPAGVSPAELDPPGVVCWVAGEKHIFTCHWAVRAQLLQLKLLHALEKGIILALELLEFLLTCVQHRRSNRTWHLLVVLHFHSRSSTIWHLCISFRQPFHSSTNHRWLVIIIALHIHHLN